MSMVSSSPPGAEGVTLGSLAVQVNDLSQRVQRLEQPLSPLPDEGTLNQLRAMTRRLFPGPLEVSVEVDPEHPARRWTLFEVEAAGEYREYRDFVQRWHDEVARIVPDSAIDCRLCVVPTQ